MGNSEIVERLAKEGTIRQLIKKEVPYYRPEHKDLEQDIYIDLLEKPEKKLEVLVSASLLRPYLQRIVKNNIHSKSSRFYYQYRRFNLLNTGEESTAYRECPDQDQGLFS